MSESRSVGAPRVCTFSIVGADPPSGEVGVAVASRFFAVGTVVPHARANVGAVATQSHANTTFGPEGLDLLIEGLDPARVIARLLDPDAGRATRQVGVVDGKGRSATYTGADCVPWAGGRSGPGYAVQGNILTGENVVVEMERVFLESQGEALAQRLFLALEAGEGAGGDSRGKQSAAIVVVRERAGYGGFSDKAVDLRVDDHADPVGELGRLVRMGIVNDHWNRGWTAFKEERFAEALKWQRKTAQCARNIPGMLPEVLYDLAVISLANRDLTGAREALDRAVGLNPALAEAARKDSDLEGLNR